MSRTTSRSPHHPSPEPTNPNARPLKLEHLASAKDAEELGDRIEEVLGEVGAEDLGR